MAASAGRIADVLARVIEDYIDARSLGDPLTGGLLVVRLPSLGADTVAAMVEEWMRSDVAGSPI